MVLSPECFRCSVGWGKGQEFKEREINLDLWGGLDLDGSRRPC